MKTKVSSVWIHGLSGRMGQAIKKAMEKEPQLKLLESDETKREIDQAKLIEAQLIIDFSSPEGSKELFESLVQLQAQNKYILIGTTGLDEVFLAKWREKLSHTNTILWAPNTSLGASLFLRSILFFVKNIKSNRDYFDIELIETHHKEKKDAPSGTALSIAQKIKEELGGDLKFAYRYEGKKAPRTMGIHSIRGGGVFGEHKIRFIGEHEEVCFEHKAFSRELFAVGAIHLSRWLMAEEHGFYSVLDLMDKRI